jgi:serine phosphatase RsbU (regulator of sigma subunit)
VKNKFKLFILFFSLFFLSKFSFGQLKDEGLCYVKNYSSTELRFQPQTWAIAQDLRGVMFFGTTSGILEFDGANWWVFHQTLIRSLCLDSISGIVYAGGVGDFGYISADKKGRSIYVSLLDKVPPKYRDFGDIWYTYVTSNGIYFIGHDKIFRLKNGKIRVWTSENQNFHTAFKLGNSIYVRDKTRGLLQIKDETLELIEGSEALGDDKIYGIIPINENEFLLASRNQGLLKMISNKEVKSNADNRILGPVKFQRINNSVSDFLIESSVYNIIELKSGGFAIGTVKEGMVCIDENLKSYSLISKPDGLLDVIVNKVFQDRQENLWLALNNSISLVDFNSPYRFYNEKIGLDGNMESLEKFGLKHYYAGSQGLFVKEDNSINIKKISQAGNECWAIKKITLPKKKDSPILLLGNRNGLFEVIGENCKKIFDESPVYFIYQSLKYPNELYLGLGDGMFRMEYLSGKWESKGYIGDFSATIRSIVEDKEGNVWATSHISESVFKIKRFNSSSLGKQIVKFEIEEYNDENGWIFGQGNPFLLNDKILIYSQEGIFEPKKTKNGLSFIKYRKNGFERIVDNDFKAMSLDSLNKIWISASSNETGLEKVELGVIKMLEDGKYSFEDLPFKRISDEFIPSSILVDDNGKVWYGLVSGAITYNSKVHSHTPYYAFNSFIRYVVNGSDTFFGGSFIKNVFSKYQKEKVSTLSLTQTEITQNIFSYKNNNLTFQCGSSSYLLSNYNQYSFFLEGNDEEWSAWSAKSEKVYTNLSEGNYVFKVRCKNNFQKVGTIAEYKFTILPPWYRTIWAYIVYIILIVLFVIMVVRLYTKGLNRIIHTQTFELKKQNSQIEHKNKEITDSIYYAKRIQEAIMPSQDYILKMFADSFIFFKPKDIVSGDFYWAGIKDGKNVIAAVDCTGHGVPGAFMSLMGNENLNEIINEKGVTQPNVILEQLRSNIIRDLKQNEEGSSSKDGMDVGLISYEPNSYELNFAGANNPVYIIRGKEKENLDGFEISEENTTHKLFEIKGNKFPVGVFLGKELPPFTNHKIKVLHGDSVYLFSDGYPDQFGGPKGKKFKYNQLKKVLLDNQHLTVRSNAKTLEEILKDWQGDLEQVDDILIIGFKIS